MFLERLRTWPGSPASSQLYVHSVTELVSLYTLFPSAPSLKVRPDRDWSRPEGWSVLFKEILVVPVREPGEEKAPSSVREVGAEVSIRFHFTLLANEITNAQGREQKENGNLACENFTRGEFDESILGND